MSKFRKGFWIHDKSMDVFYEILSVPYSGSKYTKIKYLCWNKNEFGKPFRIDTNPLKTKIYKEDYSKWKRYSPSEDRK